MAFKAESDDIRSSLSYKLSKLLRSSAKAVLSTDPFVTIDPGARCRSRQVVATSDILVLGVPHTAYHDLDCAASPSSTCGTSIGRASREVARKDQWTLAENTVLVTGGTGFLGSGRSCARLLRAGAIVRSLDDDSRGAAPAACATWTATVELDRRRHPRPRGGRPRVQGRRLRLPPRVRQRHRVLLHRSRTSCSTSASRA